MSKICNNCGCELEDSATVCTQCGNTEAPAAQSISEKISEVINLFKANPKKLIVPGAIAVGVIAVLIVVLVLFSGPAYGSALDTYFDVTVLCKFDKLEKLAPEEYWEFVEEEEGMDIDDVKEFLEEYADEALEGLEDEYGKNLKVKYTVEKEKQWKDKKVEDVADAIEDAYDIDADSVKAVYELKLEVTISGSEDDDDEDAELFVIKIGSKWYVADIRESGDDYIVSFFSM